MPTESRRLTILVTHLLGTGHLSRALALGGAFAATGWQVDVISGGRPAPHLTADGVTLHQLPPLASDGADFATLLTADGRPAGPADFAARRSALLALAERLRPDVLICELFPFGRRALAPEFEALLEQLATAERRPLVLASVRDILAPPSKPARIAETEARLARFYDGVLVHSDPAVIPLERSWPVTPAIGRMLHYTGFVAPALPLPDGGEEGRDEILVTAGGGPVGRILFEAAARCAAQNPQWRWRLLLSAGEAGFADELRRMAPEERLIVEPVRPDFRSLLSRARAAIGRCGYNTALDCLALGIPAVFCPFEDGKETEQATRAAILATRPGFAVVREADLSPAALAAALTLIDGAVVEPLPPQSLSGAARSVEFAERLLAEHRR